METTKFEIGKIYASKRGYGCGYDRIEHLNCYQIMKRTAKTATVRVATFLTENFGKVMPVPTDTDIINKINKSDIGFNVRITLDSTGAELFKDNTYADPEYVFIKYCRVIG